jgi:hypothetical protein
MIFDTSRRLYLTVIREIANLVEPDIGQDERPISTFSFDLTIIQAQCLNDSLKEQFDGLFAIVVQVVLPRPSFLRQLLRLEDPSDQCDLRAPSSAAAQMDPVFVSDRSQFSICRTSRSLRNSISPRVTRIR